MDPAVCQELQRVADECRAELAKGFGARYRIEGIGRAPLDINVIPDGVTWIAKIASGDRVFLDGAVDPPAFLANLYVVLVYCARALLTPPEKPS